MTQLRCDYCGNMRVVPAGVHDDCRCAGCGAPMRVTMEAPSLGPTMATSMSLADFMWHGPPRQSWPPKGEW